MNKPRPLFSAFVSIALICVFSLNAFAVQKFNHADYLPPKTSDNAGKSGNPIKGDVAFDSSAKTMSFVDQRGAPVVTIPYDKIKSMLYELSSKPRYAEAIL